MNKNQENNKIKKQVKKQTKQQAYEDSYDHWMRIALDLAEKGCGFVAQILWLVPSL